MARFAALTTSDPTLVACELDRVREQVELDEDGLVVGVGAYEEAMVLQRRYGVGASRTDLWEVAESDSVILCAQRLPVGQSLEDHAQPFRFRQWLFAQVGEVEPADRVREKLVAQLPEFLQRSMRGATLSGVTFGVFLAELRSLGRIEDAHLEAPVAAQVLLRAARYVENAAAELGGTSRPSMALVATNGRVLVAARRGSQSLSYSLLEGEAACKRHGLTQQSRDTDPLVRDHRRRKSVVVATDPRKIGVWVPLPEGGAVAIDRRMQVQTLDGAR